MFHIMRPESTKKRGRCRARTRKVPAWPCSPCRRAYRNSSAYGRSGTLFVERITERPDGLFCRRGAEGCGTAPGPSGAVRYGTATSAGRTRALEDEEPLGGLLAGGGRVGLPVCGAGQKLRLPGHRAVPRAGRSVPGTSGTRGYRPGAVRPGQPRSRCRRGGLPGEVPPLSHPGDPNCGSAKIVSASSLTSRALSSSPNRSVPGASFRSAPVTVVPPISSAQSANQAVWCSQKCTRPSPRTRG